MSCRSVCLGVLLCGVMVSMVGCVAPGDTPQAKRDHIQRMKEETLSSFYQDKPELRQMVKSSVGYAVFSNFSMGLIPGGGSGYGVLVDNTTGQQTYMQMGQFSLGFAIMIKDWRSLLLFDDAKVMAEFARENWVCGGTAEAVFNFGEFGAQTNATGYFGHGIRVYELTENGVSLRAFVPLIKYSPYNYINTPPTAK
jgi:lipid-binding SYLF domain-containing protein